MRWNVLLVAVAASWGFVSIIAAAVELPAEVLVLWRCLLAAASLPVLLLALGRLASIRLDRHRVRVLALGALLALQWFLFFAAVKRSSVSVAILTVYTAPIFVAVLAPRSPARSGVLGRARSYARSLRPCPALGDRPRPAKRHPETSSKMGE